MNGQRSGIRWALAPLLALSALLPQAAAAQSELQLRDYVLTTWTQFDGIPLGRASRIFQTTDGRLWVAAGDHGLLRFDGMRFVRANPPLCADPVRAIVAAAPDGGYWSLCGSRLVRRTPAGRFVEIKDWVPTARTPLLNVGADGRAWFSGLSIQYFDRDGRAGPSAPSPTRSLIMDATLDSDGALWVTDEKQVFRLLDGHTKEVPIAGVRCLAPTRQGGVLAVAQDRVWHLHAGSVRPVASTPPGVTLGNYQGCIREGTDGIWIATRQHGVALLQHGRIETLAEGRGDHRQVTEIFIDREGTTWFATTSGLHRVRKPLAQPVRGSLAGFEGAPSFAFVDSKDAVWTGPVEGNRVSATKPNGDRQVIAPAVAIGEDSAGQVWLSDRRNIGRVIGGRFVAVRDVNNAPVAGVLSLTRDARGQLWALAADVGVYRVVPGPPRLVIPVRDAASRLLVSEHFGTWVSLGNGGVQQHIDGRIDTFRPPGSTEKRDMGPAKGLALAIVEDAGSIWVGTWRGLRRWRRGRWTDWSAEHGLPGDGKVEAIASDDSGRLWMMTDGGIVILPRAQFDATPDGEPRRLSFAQIGILDGVIPHPGNLGQSPRVSRDGRGRLLFTTMDAVVRVDPSALPESSMAPPIVLDAVTIDNQPIDHTTPQAFVEPSRVQFDYTSLGLRSPENARFRYRLDGYDANWIEAGGQRQVTYGTLGPGHYRFRVIGAGSEGVWNETGADYAFQVTPVFWRTWWFRITLFATASLMAVAFHQLRVRQLRRQFDIALEARLGERTRVAREIHDTLLQTVQGSKLVVDHALARLGSDDETRRAMEQVSAWLGKANTEGRDAVDSLRATSIAAAELTDALSRAVDECRQRSSLELSLSVSGERRELHPHIGDNVYRIGYEAIRNACSHSGGSRVDVEVTYARDLTVRITDDGIGVDPAMANTGRPGHFGLQGMRERAERIGARFSIVSAANGGTTVTLSVPGRIGFKGTGTGVVDRLRQILSR